MILISVELRDLLELEDFTVDAYLGVSAAAKLVEKLLVMALATPYQRSKQIALAAGIFRYYQINNLSVGITYHLAAGLRRICP